MNPVRRIYEDAPDMIIVPEDLRHQRIERIIWPLGDEPVTAPEPPYQKCSVAAIVIPSREKRHTR